MADGVPLSAPLPRSSAPAGGALARRVISAAALLPLAVYVVAFAPSWAFALVVLAVGALSQWELAQLLERGGVPTFPLLAVVSGAVVTASFAARELQPLALTAVFGAALTAGLFQRGDLAGAWRPVAATLLGVGYVGWLLGHALWLRALPGGAEWMLLLVAVTSVGEIAAYAVGSTVGRRKLAPRVSPGKTVEGAVAQLAASLVTGVLGLHWLLPAEPPALGALIGLCLGVAGQIGDLVESLLKRSVGSKDAGQLIPGHGGILDRIDGLLFNTPVLYYLVAHARSVGA
jgi:phosphatidate cytidylyltransferase